ncbi:MAG: MinD/ParA family protein [Lachnospiraceae bacterium]|nr:MinD/ParA family protein [Lachnospiraceae bacterium]
MDQATQLRKMMQTDAKPQARVITVTSGKGGVGKTSISLNLAIQLTRMGKKVVVFDADFGLANIEVMLGVRPQYNLADMMFHGKELADILTQGEEGICFISGGSGIQELASMNREQVLYLTSRLVELDQFADVIIVDTGAGISDSVLEFVLSSTEVLLVATPEPTSITDAYALLKALNRKAEFSKEETSIKMISNRVRSEAEGQNLYEKMRVVSDKFLSIPIEYIGAVPMDEQITKAVMRQKPVSVINPEAPAAKAIKKIAGKILELDSETKERWGISQLFSNLIRNKMLKKNM